MANDRNAGRKKKYKFESTTITFKIPLDVQDLCRKAVREIIDNQAQRYNPNVESNVVKQVQGAMSNIQEDVIASLPKQNKCDCYMDGAIMKRGKSVPACKLTKAQHKF